MLLIPPWWLPGSYGVGDELCYFRDAASLDRLAVALVVRGVGRGGMWVSRLSFGKTFR